MYRDIQHIIRTIYKKNELLLPLRSGCFPAAASADIFPDSGHDFFGCETEIPVRTDVYIMKGQENVLLL